nr:hypothetical protein Iba_chr15aCG9950 [Ipomoea batatas]
MMEFLGKMWNRALVQDNADGAGKGWHRHRSVLQGRVAEVENAVAEKANIIWNMTSLPSVCCRIMSYKMVQFREGENLCLTTVLIAFDEASEQGKSRLATVAQRRNLLELPTSFGAFMAEGLLS